jgi:predicted deacetylase
VGIARDPLDGSFARATRLRAPLRLAVSLHDVAPQTWPACERLLGAVEQVAPIPVTLLIVPNYHGEGLRRFTPAYRGALDARLARGDELALHGWTHLDACPLPRNPIDILRRTRLTAREGEFAALPAHRARALLQEGAAWFDKQGWPLHGFVAPAWLMSQGSWHAVAGLPFEYATTLGSLHLLPERIPVPTRTFVYSVRTRLRRHLSLLRNDALRRVIGRTPIVRLALHPADAAHDDVVRHCQALLECLLPDRLALRKAQLARELRAELVW